MLLICNKNRADDVEVKLEKWWCAVTAWLGKPQFPHLRMESGPNEHPSAVSILSLQTSFTHLSLPTPSIARGTLSEAQCRTVRFN